MSHDPIATPVGFRQLCAFSWAQAHLSAYLARHPAAKYDDALRVFSQSFESGLYVADHLSDSLNGINPSPGELRDADVSL